jgi:thiol-disulfide isomerase/thioredoxin
LDFGIQYSGTPINAGAVPENQLLSEISRVLAILYLSKRQFMGNRAELRRRRKQQNRYTTLGVLAGLGFILLAMAALLMLPKSNMNGAGSAQNLFAIPAKVNYPAPELSLENIKGNFESLADFQGKVVMINNWATWCPPCKAEMPTLVAFYNDHAKDGLMIVAVEAGEPKDEVQKFVDQFQMPFTVWLDPDGKSLNAFKNGNLPNSYVIDRTGTVRLAWTGEINREALEKYVTPLLAGI